MRSGTQDFIVPAIVPEKIQANSGLGTIGTQGTIVCKGESKGGQSPVPHINTNIYFVTHSLMERVFTSSISFSSNAARGIVPRSPPLRLRTAITLFSTSLSPIISM